jgi:histidyl-tRNA synthetase
MRDLPHREWRWKKYLRDLLADLIGSYGYVPLDTPLLESTELFLRKSGGELASRIYSFTDPGSNSVSLRPEFTASIMRYYLERADDIELPTRWQYSGPVFRYEDYHPERSGQFTQIGAELLGSSSMMADVELLALAAQVPPLLHINDWRLELTDLDLVRAVVDAVGLSERAKTFIINNLATLKDGRDGIDKALDEARLVHLTGGNDEDYLAQAVVGLDDDKAKVVLRGLLQWSAADQVGQRDPSEVVDRLLRKLRGSDDIDSLRQGLELTSNLVAIRGEPSAALREAEEVLRGCGADPAAGERLGKFIELVLDVPEIRSHLTLDFGLVRGLAYYNGIMFDVTHPETLGSLGGGGRYDGLARALGASAPVPALGFAYNLEVLSALSAFSQDSRDSEEPGNSSLVMAADPAGYQQALRVAVELRQNGAVAEVDVGEKGLEQALAYAAKKKISQVVVVDDDGRRTAHRVE